MRSRRMRSTRLARPRRTTRACRRRRWIAAWGLSTGLLRLAVCRLLHIEPEFDGDVELVEIATNGSEVARGTRPCVLESLHGVRDALRGKVMRVVCHRNALQVLD